jgi:hypothetical protein
MHEQSGAVLARLLFLMSQTRANRHSDDGVTKMVVFRDPERSVLIVREHRKRGEAPFAGRQG